MIVVVHTPVRECPCHIGEQFIHDARVTAGEEYKEISVDLDKRWERFSPSISWSSSGLVRVTSLCWSRTNMMPTCLAASGEADSGGSGFRKLMGRAEEMLIQQ